MNLKMTPLEKIHAFYVIRKSIVSDDNVEDDIELRKLADKFFIDYKTRVVVVAFIFFPVVLLSQLKQRTHDRKKYLITKKYFTFQKPQIFLIKMIIL